jgi:hypothetical protein
MDPHVAATEREFSFSYEPDVDSTLPGGASLRLRIGDALLWASPDGSEGVVRCWADFLIGLAENWKYLLLEEV